jgi:hypothetical protein
MFDLAFAFESCIKLLTRAASMVARRFEHVSPAIGYDHRRAATLESRGLDQSLLAEVTKVAVPRIGGSTRVPAQSRCRHHPERTDGRQRSALGSAQRVRAFACVVNDLTVGAARQAQIPSPAGPATSLATSPAASFGWQATSPPAYCALDQNSSRFAVPDGMPLR